MRITRREALADAAVLGLVVPHATSGQQPQPLNRESVPSLRDFGAACDGKIDDTAAVQRALDHCARAKYPTTLIVPGRTRLTDSVTIDRPVDGTVGDFVLEGSGPGAGFFVDRPVTLFTSSLGHGVFNRQKTPSSEYITFRNLLLEARDSALAAYVVSDRLFRYRVEGCSIRRLRWLAHADYVQSVYFTGCNIRGWSGIFFNADDGYDIAIHGTSFEAGGAGINFNGAVTKFSASGEIYEGCAGTFVAISGANAFSVEGMYFEENGATEIVLGSKFGVSRGVLISGCAFNVPAARASDYPIRLGVAYGVNISGNYSNGRLVDNSELPPFTLAPAANYTESGADGYKSDPWRETGMATAGRRQSDATEIKRSLNLFDRVNEAGQAARLPSVRTTFRERGIVIANLSDKSMSLFPAPNERFWNMQVNTPVVIAPRTKVEAFAAGVDSWLLCYAPC